MEELLNLENNEKLIAEIKTSMGNMELELFPNEAPKTVENFVGLSLKGYYNGVIFHRVIEGFMIQGGDPTGTGMGGESFWGGTFEDEFSPNLRHDKAGTLSMANAGPGTNGSQFFITLVPTDWLNDKHSIFGQLVAGEEVLAAIGSVETSKPYDKPLKDIVINEINISKK